MLHLPEAHASQPWPSLASAVNGQYQVDQGVGVGRTPERRLPSEAGGPGDVDDGRRGDHRRREAAVVEVSLMRLTLVTVGAGRPRGDDGADHEGRRDCERHDSLLHSTPLIAKSKIW